MPLTTRTDAVASPVWAAAALHHSSLSAARMLIALALLLAPALAVMAEETSFQAVVSQDKVEVRAGNSNQFYVVGTLERGARVTVVDIIGGWNLIVPPPGVSSFIAKADVTSDNGKTGTVKAEKAMVRVLGPKGANIVESYKPHATLLKGATVNILSESGEYYIIEPPPGATVYLAPGTVRHAEGAPAPVAAAPHVEPKPAAPKPPAPAKVEPAKPKTVIEAKPEAGVSKDAAVGAMPVAVNDGGASEVTKGGASAAKPEAKPEPDTAPAPVVMEPATKPAKPAKTVRAKPEPTGDGTASTDEKPASRGAVFVPVVRAPAPATAAQADDAAATTQSSGAVLGDSATVRDLESKIAAAARQPIEKRPLAELLAGYEKASDSADLSPTDRKIVSVRIGQIQDNLTLQKAVASAEAVRKENSKPITLPAPPPPPKPGVYNPADYDAVGQLLASTVYDGDASPRLLRIADPANQRTVAYVLPGPKVDVQQLLGRIVGVKGDAKYDPALRLRVITVEKIDLLQVEAAPK
jgi:hypothetical protein